MNHNPNPQWLSDYKQTGQCSVCLHVNTMHCGNKASLALVRWCLINMYIVLLMNTAIKCIMDNYYVYNAQLMDVMNALICNYRYGLNFKYYNFNITFRLSVYEIMKPVKILKRSMPLQRDFFLDKVSTLMKHSGSSAFVSNFNRSILKHFLMPMTFSKTKRTASVLHRHCSDTILLWCFSLITMLPEDWTG